MRAAAPIVGSDRHRRCERGRQARVGVRRVTRSFGGGHRDRNDETAIGRGRLDGRPRERDGQTAMGRAGLDATPDRSRPAGGGLAAPRPATAPAREGGRHLTTIGALGRETLRGCRRD